MIMAKGITEIIKDFKILHPKAYEKIYEKGRTDALVEFEEAMYHHCFECDVDEDMQKWKNGYWIRYKLFENVMEQLKEKKNEMDK